MKIIALIIILCVAITPKLKAQQYCLNIDTARMLVNDVVRARVLDSIIIVYEKLLYDLRAERDTLYITDNQAIDSLKKQVVGISDLFKEQWKRADKAEGDLKEEKQKDFVVGPGVGLDYMGRPTISINVTYRIWSFRVKRK